MPNVESHSRKIGTDALSKETSPSNRRNTMFFKQALQSAVLEAADVASQHRGHDIDAASPSVSSALIFSSSASAAASTSDLQASSASNGPIFHRQASLAHLDGADSARATSIAQQARLDQEARTRAANEQRAWDDFVAKFTGVGFRVRKHGRWGAPHERQLVFETATQQVSWGSTSDAKFPLSAVLQIVTGKDTDCLQRTDASVPGTHCFSLITADRTLDLQTGSAAERDFLVFNLRKLRALSEAPLPKQRSGWSGHPEF
jgi:hypothetical protein